MEYILILIITTSLIYFYKEKIKKYPLVFYLIAIFLSVLTVIYKNIALSNVINTGYVSLVLFVIVMFLGALNRKKKNVAKMFAIRGVLSISAFIFLIPHAVVAFIGYASNFFTDWGIIFGIMAFVVMVPLFITSFLTIRKRLDAKDWKSLHKWSYFVYLATYIHLFLLANSSNQVFYSLTFLVYTIIRFNKTKFSTALKYTFYLTAIVLTFILNQGNLFVQTQQIDIASLQFTDGTYTGNGTGYHNLQVSVTVSIKNNKITNIQVKNCGCTGYPYQSILNQNVSTILNQQSLNIDSVSGATHSTHGLYQAITNALNKATK